MGPRAGTDVCGKFRPPTGIRSPDRPAHRHSLYRLPYPGFMTAVTNSAALHYFSEVTRYKLKNCLWSQFVSASN